MTSAALKLQVGARTLATIPRTIVRVPLSLADALGGATPVLPPLSAQADGYLVTSLPESVVPAWNGVTFVRQRYDRHYLDLAAGEAAWRQRLSGQTRSTLKRKAKKLAEASGGALEVRRYRTSDELAAAHPLARRVSATTYQERLMGAGLPDDPRWLAEQQRLAAGDAVRAWLLFLAGEPIAYLWCGADGAALRYDHVGHDPGHHALSPGSVLMDVALTDLFADRFRWFDFTEGEGQHKRTLASGGVACRDVLLLKPTLANRGAVAAVGGFDAAMAWAKARADTPLLRGLAKKVRRAG